ncbi:MAG: ABC transporter permease, partial [Oscillospiraceae bacterium]
MKTKGWQQVFSFTFIQYVKAKSFIISTIVLCLITIGLVAGVNIIPKLIENEEEQGISPDGTDTSALSVVYLVDESGVLTDEDTAALTEAGLTLAVTDKTADELLEKLSVSEANEAMVRITSDEIEGEVVGYRVKTYYSPALDSSAVDNATAMVEELVTRRNLLNAGVTEDTYAATQRYVQTSKIQAGSGEWNMIESALNYFIPLAVSLFLFMLIFVYGNTVAQSIAIEKTSRVMELLLTSVRPLAVVIGKVLAMGLVSIAQLIIIGSLAGITFMVTAPFGIGGEVMEIMQSPELQQVAENAEIAEAVNNTIGNFSALSFILVLLCFLLSMLITNDVA